MRRGNLNCSVDIRYSIFAFNMSLLTAKLQLRSPHRNVRINWSPPWDKICSNIFQKGLFRSAETLFQYNYHSHRMGFIGSWKQCLNLWSRRWLRNRRNLRSSIPYGLWISKILFAQGRIKFRRSFLKIERLLEFLIF